LLFSLRKRDKKVVQVTCHIGKTYIGFFRLQAMAEDINALIEKHALANAFSHGGKAQAGSII